MLIIGVDEAGYGPNLGPLVVGASAWWVPDGQVDLYQQLQGIVASRVEGDALAIADSKLLYTSGGTLAKLERALFATRLANAAKAHDICFQEFTGQPLDDLPWYANYNPSLPIEAQKKDVDSARERLAAQQCAIPLGVWVRVVEPSQFNDGVAKLETKGALLSSLSIELAKSVIDCIRPSDFYPLPSADPAPTLLLFDKHGGRNFYAGLLQHTLDCDWVEPIVEGRGESRYRCRAAGREISASFRAKGESQLPTALASMAAKYVRELCMKAFNDFWCNRVAGLQPTAGYPVDAARFRKQIAPTQKQLGISDDRLWRCR